ncbi:MAG: hypothetical protein WC321_07350 [Candidatus Omnitrophota bacterium]|jgi:Xaa-Pro aminopeptidase
MDKKDIYEHLAKIYLDASSKKKKSTKKNKNPKALFFTGLALIFIFSAISLSFFAKTKNAGSKPNVTSEFVFVLEPDIVRMNFNFDPVKKELYALSLNKLNLASFKALRFSARKADFDAKVVLKVEFTNAAKESSEILIADLTSFKWQDYKIPLSAFKNIKDWHEIESLSFAVEEKDTKNKKGIVYIDSVRLLR